METHSLQADSSNIMCKYKQRKKVNREDTWEIKVFLTYFREDKEEQLIFTQ